MGRATRLAAVAALLMFAMTACNGASASSAADTADVMAISLYQLVTVDNTFGGYPPPFTTFLIQTRTDPGVFAPENAATRSLTRSERDAIESAISPLGTVQWIDDPADWRTDNLLPTIEGSAILGVGEPIFDSKGALVPVSLWCSGLCGTWFSYRLEHTGDDWQITGIEGPRAVS